IVILLATSCSSSNSTIKKSVNIDYKKAALLNVELGRSYLAQGYTERAKKKFLHALELMPNLAESHSGIGYFWEVVGEAKEAEKHYKKSIYLGKGNGLFYNQYALFLCVNSRYKEANKNFMLAANDKSYTKTADVYNNAGLCALKYNDQQQAEQYLTKALYHDPRRTNLFLELANLNLDQKNFTAAENYLNRFYKNNKNKLTPSYLWLNIKLANRLGYKDKISSQALLLKNLFPNSPEYNMYRSEYEKG
ncbi:MAG: type IV pilus biogenesis/stability protein PilW, partial [Gammaproteobacteria bacterium]